MTSQDPKHTRKYIGTTSVRLQESLERAFFPEAEVKCRGCGRKFKSLYWFRNHVRNSHPDKRGGK